MWWDCVQAIITELFPIVEKSKEGRDWATYRNIDTLIIEVVREYEHVM
jgi:hypothetical protein